MSPQSRQEVLITDVVERVADGKLSPVNRKGHWRIFEYELEKVGPGRGVATNDHLEPGPLTIRLGLMGHYRISFISCYSQIRAKLTGERCFDECEPVFEGVEKEGWYDVEEVFWREADLTDKDLILDDEALLFDDSHSISLLAIRLTPTEPKGDSGEVRWPMVFTNDGGNMGERLHRSPDDLFECNERAPQDGCARVVIYSGIEGDICSHFTREGTECGESEGEGWTKGHRMCVENLRRYHQWGINPADAMVEYAHNRGWEVYFYVRHRGWGDAWPQDGPVSSRFYLEHPEYRNVGPDGEPVLGLSIAYPEVREHLYRFYAELADFGADGVSPCFIRGCPIVLYEPPMVEGFKQQYGKDPRELAESDPRWLDYTAAVVTDWMRELKEAIGPKCKLGPMIHGTESLNRQFGMDIAAWVKEEIVADLFIMGHQYDRFGCHSQGGLEHLDYEYFQKLPGRENVRLWPMFYMWQWFEADPQKYCGALQEFLDAGADGYGFWDAAAFPTEKRGNIWDLGKLPRPTYEVSSRLLAKYERIRFCGYPWNRYSAIESW